jgi:hypothetical protein
MLTKTELKLFTLKSNLVEKFLKNKQFKRFTEKLGVQILKSGFYSSTPMQLDLAAHYTKNNGVPLYLDDSVFDLNYINLRLISLKRFQGEYLPQEHADQTGKFYYANPMFSHSDAMSYYCLIREAQPANIIEIGSGFSTSIAKQAIIDSNSRTKIHSFEPYPTEFLRSIDGVNLIDKKAQEISSDEINNLIQDGDIFFVDSTHTVKEGSDVIHIICNLLPKINKKIYVHFHDIFLPFCFPQDWVVEESRYWEEQYLLYAFLLGNKNAKVFYGSTLCAHYFPELMAEFTFSKFSGGGSIWFELN